VYYNNYSQAVHVFSCPAFFAVSVEITMSLTRAHSLNSAEYCLTFKTTESIKLGFEAMTLWQNGIESNLNIKIRKILKQGKFNPEIIDFDH
jgi:hypothetical protein